MYHEARERHAQLEQIQEERKQLLEIKAEAETISGKWEMWKAKKDRLESRLPLEKDLPFALVSLEHTINQHSLTLHSMRTGGKTVFCSYGKQSLELSLSGKPDSIEVFLDQVAGLTQFIAFDCITWSKQDQQGVKLDLVLELYYIEPAEITAGSAGVNNPGLNCFP